MSASPDDKLRQSGERLAGVLSQYIDAEFEDLEERAQVKLAVYDSFGRQTAMHRRPDNPWPPEAMHRRPGEWPDPDETSTAS